MHKMTVAVAMSGGVDSSVACALLQRQGYEVIGFTMRLLPASLEENGSTPFGGCCSIDAVEKARAVCAKLGVPHYVINARELFTQAVIADFYSEIASAHTPNPCAECNRSIKFRFLLQRAWQVGAQLLATGHYARAYRANGRHLLLRGVDRDKDQSYFLFPLTQEALAHTLFPLGEMHKQQVRKTADELGLPTASVPDSQDLCFLPARGRKAFLRRRLSPSPGPIVDVRSGKVCGEHRGVAFYTIGQRKGLGLATGEPLYVVALDAATNSVYVGPEETLWRCRFAVASVNWIAQPPRAPFRA